VLPRIGLGLRLRAESPAGVTDGEQSAKARADRPDFMPANCRNYRALSVLKVQFVVPVQPDLLGKPKPRRQIVPINRRHGPPSRDDVAFVAFYNCSTQNRNKG
jgi:hypothetical protein